MSWPGAVQQVTGRTIHTVQQHTQARGASPFEASTFGIRDSAAVLVSHLTTYDGAHQPIEHSRFAWPVDAVQISTNTATQPTASPSSADAPRAWPHSASSTTTT